MAAAAGSFGIDRSLSAAPRRASIQTLLGAAGAAQREGDPSAARALYTEVLARQPGNLFAHYDLGVLDQAAGSPVAASEQYRAALRADPAYVPALYNDATLLARSHPRRSVDLYRRAISIQPRSPTAYLNLGLLLARLGHDGTAGRDLLTALHQDPALFTDVPSQDRHLLDVVPSSPPDTKP